jgi:hypothetical protein
VLIVLDTNMFRGDVNAERPWLQAVLDGAEHGDFEVVVPEAVVQELVRQYPERVRAAIDEVTEAAARAKRSLTPFGFEAPVLPSYDPEQSIADYESALRERLSGPGVRIAPQPDDLTPAVNWAVQRRKPFKDSGSGMPDASIWLTCLELATDADSVLLASTNTTDFGDEENPRELARELVADLYQRRLPTRRVRLISDLKVLVEEIVEPMAEAEARAERLLGDPDLSRFLTSGITDAVAYTEVPQDAFELGIQLDNDPQVEGADVAKLELLSTREAVDSEHLFLEVRALTDLRLSMAVYKADYYIADSDIPVSISADDINDHYFDGEAEVSAWLTLTIHTDLYAEDVQVELLDVTEASAEERIAVRIEQSSARQLIEALKEPNSWASSDVAYQPDLPLEGDVEEASLEDLSAEEVELVSVDDHLDQGVSCTLRVCGKADIRWVVSSPSGLDEERHGAFLEGEPGGGGWLSNHETDEAVVMTVRAVLTPADEWMDVGIEEVGLTNKELSRRSHLGREEESDEEMERLEASGAFDEELGMESTPEQAETQS